MRIPACSSLTWESSDNCFVQSFPPLVADLTKKAFPALQAFVGAFPLLCKREVRFVSLQIDNTSVEKLKQPSSGTRKHLILCT